MESGSVRVVRIDGELCTVSLRQYDEGMSLIGVKIGYSAYGEMRGMIWSIISPYEIETADKAGCRLQGVLVSSRNFDLSTERV